MSAPGAEQDLPRDKQHLPTVRVHAMTIGLAHDMEPSEWFACCTDQVWMRPENRRYADETYRSCNWYGRERDDKRDAQSDAARHRRTHRALYARPTGAQQ